MIPSNDRTRPFRGILSQLAKRTCPKRKLSVETNDFMTNDEDFSVHRDKEGSANGQGKSITYGRKVTMTHRSKDELEACGRSPKRMRMSNEPDRAPSPPEFDCEMPPPGEPMNSIEKKVTFHSHGFCFKVQPEEVPVPELAKTFENASPNRRIRVIGPAPPKSPLPAPKANHRPPCNSIERDIFGLSDGGEVGSKANYSWSAAARDADEEERDKARSSLLSRLYGMPYTKIAKIDKRARKKVQLLVNSRDIRKEIKEMVEVAREMNDESQKLQDEIVASRLALEQKVTRWKKVV